MNSINVFAFADEASSSLEGQIAAMKRNHLNGVEMRSVDDCNVSDLTLNRAKEIRNRLDDEGLAVWSLGSPIGKIEIVDNDFPEDLDRLKHTLELADVLGAKNIRMFSFYMPHDADPAQYKDEVFSRMSAMLEAAKGSGIDLCHENEKNIYGDVASRCLELYREFPALRAVFDPANFIQCGQDTWEAWQMLKPYVKYLHIKDALADGNVVPAGKGIGNVAKTVGEYRAMGGENVSVEPHLAVFDGLQALERGDDKSGIGSYCYESNDAAFDAACTAFWNLIRED